jgi:two-component system LytT family response regulator
MNRARAFVVEDEPVARQQLCEWIDACPWLVRVGEAANAPDAIAAVRDLEPDVLFLDVEIPGGSGLDVLAAAPHDPHVVFTTAYDRYAVAAFELEAVDYLLKPFGRERFEAAVERLGRVIDRDEGSGSAVERARAALESGPLRRLFAREAQRIVPIPVATVVRFEAEGDYVRAHGPQGVHLLHVALGDLEQRLDPAAFLRVHRSHIVHLDAVRQIREYGDRRFQLELTDGSTVVSSRAGAQRLRTLIR